MKILRPLWLAALAMGTMAPLFGMNNSDVIKMKKADFSEETILLAMSREPADYDTSPDALVELKKAGVTEAVIKKMMGGPPGSKEPAPSVTEPPKAGIEQPATNFATQDFPSLAPPFVMPVAGQEYFLRCTLHVEDGEYSGTNYARGVIVPINTPVKIDVIKPNAIALHRANTGDKIEIKNVEKYTRKSIGELGRLLFSKEQTQLDRLPPELASAIRSGEMRKGMTKEQVLMARGYPPAHETPSSDSDRWVYWSSRFVKQTVVFANGRLVEGRGIY